MNRVVIGEQAPQNIQKNTFFVEFSQASDLLSILRNDHFNSCQLHLPNDVTNSQLRFFMHFTRILSKQGQLKVRGSQQSIGKAKGILKNLGLFINNETQQEVVLSKKQNQVKQQKKQSKLAIGFKNIGDEQIDEDELLKNEKIDLSKNSGGGCGQKARACANCNCGRKKDEALPTKQQLVKSVNEGKPVSGCGKCYLGDSFRCATCPYQGLPAFKPGDKLKLVDNSNVIVENGAAIAQNGKVKIQL